MPHLGYAQQKSMQRGLKPFWWTICLRNMTFQIHVLANYSTPSIFLTPVMDVTVVFVDNAKPLTPTLTTSLRAYIHANKCKSRSLMDRVSSVRKQLWFLENNYDSLWMSNWNNGHKGSGRLDIPAKWPGGLFYRGLFLAVFHWESMGKLAKCLIWWD